MPIIDCEAYSFDAMKMGSMQLLMEEIESAGRDPNIQPLSYVNIYFGMQHLRTAKELPWHVCVARPFGFLTMLFHQVRHGDVVVTTVPKLAESKGLCITLIWTSGNDLPGELLDAVRTADKLIQQVEMLLGVPLPLPLKKLQLPDRFAVGTILPKAGDEEREIQISVLVPDNDYGVLVDQQTVLSIGALVGVLGPIDEIMSTPIFRALHLSSTWQRQAIRASGIEEWSEAVVASNIWIETFLVQLSVILNQAAGSPIADVQSAVMKGGFPRFINTYLGQKFLKGRWDHTDENSEFGRWFELCFSLRNQIVHAGHFATEDEAKVAYDAAHQLAHFVTARAAKMPDKRFNTLLEPLRHMSKVREKRQSKAQEKRSE